MNDNSLTRTEVGNELFTEALAANEIRENDDGSFDSADEQYCDGFRADFQTREEMIDELISTALTMGDITFASNLVEAYIKL